MDLESTIVTISNLLKLDFENSFSDFIQPQKQIMSIPDYQREYKWEKSKIKIFVDNVMQRSKFLGIFTVEVPESNFLSLVDGQQRLTTIILMLAQLYNACADEGETETQDELETLITCEINGHRILKLDNGSVGEYLHFVREQDGKRKINLEINPALDIYKQSGKFAEAWNIIRKEIYEIRQRNPDITLDVYKQQLLDCRILLFAQKNTANMQQGSSEEIYIDINEKAQKLDPEDIINKIKILRGTYIASEVPRNGTYAKKHSHIEIICQHIMKTNGYGELLAAYNNNESRANVLGKYQTFINNYFSEDHLKGLQETLTNELVQKLQDLYQMI